MTPWVQRRRRRTAEVVGEVDPLSLVDPA